MKNFIKVIDAYDIEKVINIDFIQSLYKDEDYTIIRAKMIVFTSKTLMKN